MNDGFGAFIINSNLFPDKKMVFLIYKMQKSKTLKSLPAVAKVFPSFA